MTKNYNFFSKSNCGNTISLYYETKKKPSLLNKKKKGIKMLDLDRTYIGVSINISNKKRNKKKERE